MFCIDKNIIFIFFTMKVKIHCSFEKGMKLISYIYNCTIKTNMQKKYKEKRKERQKYHKKKKNWEIFMSDKAKLNRQGKETVLKQYKKNWS